MAANNNPVSRLNEFCQKNKLTLSFEKTEEGQMCLTINRQGFREYIQFFGQGRSLKDAKCDAAKRAFEAGIIHELKKAALAVASASEASGSQMNDLVARVGSFTMGDGPDPIYQAYTTARDNNLRFFIDFGNIKRGISQIKLTVKMHLGAKQFTGRCLTKFHQKIILFAAISSCFRLLNVHILLPYCYQSLATKLLSCCFQSNRALQLTNRPLSLIAQAKEKMT